MDVHKLAKSGNIKGIRAAVSNKRAMLSLDEERGWSPLHYAANSSKTKVVKILLDAGITPNIKRYCKILRVCIITLII